MAMKPTATKFSPGLQKYVKYYLTKRKRIYHTSICKVLTPRHGVLSLNSLYSCKMQSNLKTNGHVYQEKS